MALRKIREEDNIEFTSYDQLSYEDDGSKNVKLYVDNKYVGPIKVWLDGENEDREYICLNYEIVYLYVIKKYLE